MTRHTVVWHADARDLLALIWIHGRDRAAVSRAADVVDQLLLVDADTQGRVYERSTRCLTIPPLQIYYVVDSADRMVRIVHVRRVPNLQQDGNGENGEQSQTD